MTRPWYSLSLSLSLLLFLCLSVPLSLPLKGCLPSTPRPLWIRSGHSWLRPRPVSNAQVPNCGVDGLLVSSTDFGHFWCPVLTARGTGSWGPCTAVRARVHLATRGQLIQRCWEALKLYETGRSCRRSHSKDPSLIFFTFLLAVTFTLMSADCRRDALSSCVHFEGTHPPAKLTVSILCVVAL